MIIIEQTMVQRSYNAFAVRVQAERGRERRVVPASETDEGDLCIEMRIRLKSDGLMSNLLSQLIKVRTRRRINDCKGNVLSGGRTSWSSSEWMRTPERDTITNGRCPNYL